MSTATVIKPARTFLARVGLTDAPRKEKTEAKEPAKQEAAVPVQVAKKRSWLMSRLVRGFSSAPGQYRAWLAATEYDRPVTMAEEAKDQARLIVAMRDRAEHRAARRVRAAWAWAFAVPFLFGGALMFTIAVMVVAIVTALVVRLAEMVRPGSKKSRTPATAATAGNTKVAIDPVIWIYQMFTTSSVSLALTKVDWHFGLTGPRILVWPAGLLLLLVARIVYWVGPDGSIADNLADATPEPGELNENVIVAAVKAANPPNMPKHTEWMVVAPGVDANTVPGVWTASVSTAKGDRGPSAKPLLAVRDNFASELGVAPGRLYLEVREDLGSRIDITAVTRPPWDDRIVSPMTNMPEVDLWQGVPFGTTIKRQRINLPIEGRLWMFGGSSGGGKSNACSVVDAGFLLSKHSKLWVIDGGKVDTAVIHEAGMAHRYADGSDHEGALAVLEEMVAELERREKLLVEFGVKKVSPAFFEHYGLGFDLLHFDEFGGFTRSKGKEKERAEIAKAITMAVMNIIQRGRKVGLIPLLSTQSPSADALETDARDVINDRFAVWCDGWQMSEKILGQGKRKRGIDASALKKEDLAGWLCASGTKAEVVRTDFITDEEMGLILRRAKELRSGSLASVRNLREVPTLLLAAAQLMRQREVDQMPTAEVVGRLRSAGHDLEDGIVGQRHLAAEMKRFGVTPTTDNSRASDNRGKSHYLLSDIEGALKRLGHAA